ncbi:MAG: IMPACT family protein [Flavobacteriales bacterium]
MAESLTYKCIAASSTGVYREKGSRFLSFAYPVSGEEEVNARLDELRKKHHAARHICFAYRINPERPLVRASDAGEPSNTAGKPILTQLESCLLFNVLICVVRYFGGVKLGTSGLVRAYKRAAMDVINNARIIEKQPHSVLRIRFGHSHMNDIMQWIKGNETQVLQKELGMHPEMWVEINTADLERALSFLQRIEGTQISVER